MPRPLRVLQFGLGPIGRACARAILERPSLALVAAVDRDPALVGRDLGRVLGLPRELGIRVEADVAAALRRRPALAFHTTVSALRPAIEQLRPLLEAGVDVVSSTEPMTYPWGTQPALARRLDRLARAGGATVHGTGVNPGFAMDVLALVLGHASLEVRSVRAVRVADASTRRLPLRLKVGAGLTPREFRARAQAGRIGHVGLRESMDLVAAGLGWTIDRHVHRLQPVLASRDLPGPPAVPRGGVAGQRETLRGFRGGREVMRFELVLALGAEEPRDEVTLRGRPDLTMRVEGGTPGDIATVAALLNAAPRVVAAGPGLRTPLDLPLPRIAPLPS